MTPERTCSFASRHSRKFFVTFVTPLCAEPSTKGKQHFGESTQSIETIRRPRDNTDAHDEGISRLVSLPPASPINGRADSLNSHIAPVRKVRGCVSTVIRHDTSPTLQAPCQCESCQRAEAQAISGMQSDEGALEDYAVAHTSSLALSGSIRSGHNTVVHSRFLCPVWRVCWHILQFQETSVSTGESVPGGMLC